MCELSVANTIGKKKYLVTQEYAETLPVDTFIRYSEGTQFSENEIYVRNKWDVSGSPDTWEDTSTHL